MRQYTAYFRLRFIANLQYRTAALAGVLTQFAFGFIFVMIYIAFYESGASKAPMELGEVVTYIWMQQAFYALMFLYYRDNEILGMIKNGNVAYELCRPGHLYIKWYIKILASKMASLCLKFSPIIIVALFLPDPYRLILPDSGFLFLLFLLSIGLSMLLIPAFCTMVHLLSFFLLDDRGIYTFVTAFAEIFSGMVIPLPFFPNFLQNIANFLPFRYMSDLPLRIFAGNIATSDAIFNIGIQLIWTIIFIGVGYFMADKGLKKVSVQGG
ncbi:MAG: ABC-2 family transporter protein [Bacilli bacterium]|nr:ABC-2 family transporter protein [Bacilli bacterium]